MKKVLFMLIEMNIGGTERALINMLSQFPRDSYEITVLLLNKNHGFMAYIPKEVKIKYIDNYEGIKALIENPPMNNIMNAFAGKDPVKAFILLILYVACKIKGNRERLFKYILKHYEEEKEEYDIAAAYAGPMDFITYYVLNKIRAKKKLQWIHFDVTKIGFNIKFAAEMYKNFDRIFIVSQEAKSKFLELIPSLAEKTQVFLNIISAREIVAMAEKGQGFNDNFQGLRILTVGRLSIEKGQDLTIPVLSKLISDGYNVRWYCIGDGEARRQYEGAVRDYGVENDYVFLGSTANPYTYMKQCDIYVQPSRNEGYCITIAEAKCFYRPIICTSFTGAKEQIKQEKTGLITEASEEGIYRALKCLLDGNELRKVLMNNLMSEAQDTGVGIKKILYLLDV